MPSLCRIVSTTVPRLFRSAHGDAFGNPSGFLSVPQFDGIEQGDETSELVFKTSMLCLGFKHSQISEQYVENEEVLSGTFLA